MKMTAGEELKHICYKFLLKVLVPYIAKYLTLIESQSNVPFTCECMYMFTLLHMAM